MKWRKRQKTKVDFFRATSFSLVMMTKMVYHCLFPGGLTDHWWVTASCRLPASCLWVVRLLTLTGSTTDSPLGGAALRHGRRRAVITPDNTRNHHCSLQSPLPDLLNPLRLCAPCSTQLCSNIITHTTCGILYSYWTTHTHTNALTYVEELYIRCARLNTLLSVYLPHVMADKYLLYHKYLYLFSRSPMYQSDSFNIY